MSNRLTVVMYHYVRSLQGSRYPDLHALEVNHFLGQLDFLQHHYNVVSMEEVISAAHGHGDTLPPRPVLLTFDDGYLDHYTNVVPLLIDRGLQGSFFPPACSVMEKRVLDVNKIHFTLASVEKPSELLEEIFSILDENRDNFQLRNNSEYFAMYSREGRYDTPEVTFIKRILQKGLPKTLRTLIVDRLFHRFVTHDEAAFASELYMNATQLREINNAGMFIGSHGDQHLWLNTLSPEEQEKEIEAGLSFLSHLGVSTQDWVMCYPYGGYNDSLLSLLRRKGCALGLTVDVAVADLEKNDPLRLPRLDTNDLPHSSLVASPLEEYVEKNY